MSLDSENEAALAALEAKKIKDAKDAAFNSSELQTQLQMILALKDTDPGLQEGLGLRILKGDVDGFRAAILASNFYKTKNALARQRAQAKVSQNGVYESDKAKYKASQKNRLIGVGVQWSAAIEAQLDAAYDNGLDNDDELDDILGRAGVLGDLGGSTLGTISTLKAYANSFGVNSLLDSNYWNSKSKGIFGQDITAEDIQKEIRDLSASAFPAYADSINKGVSLAAQGSSVIQTFARFLEEDPDTLSFDNTDIRQVMQYVDPKTGVPTRMPQWQVEQIVKKSPKWGLTNNARDTIDSLSLRVFKDLGLA
jgi:hypothetical protein